MSTELRAGTRVGEYILEAPLGRGGFATVWSARHHMWPDRRVAAKLLHRSDRRELLQSEADCLVRLEHEGIANAVGMDLDHDPPYLLLDLHEGRTLREVLDLSTLSPERAYHLFRQLAEAVAHAHERGVAHGDLKPENVLVNARDELKLTDFGLGNQVTTEASLMLSGQLDSAEAPPGLAGTIPYMAPEQREGRAPDPTSDVFSLGILLHEMLTGRRPQPGDDPRENLRDPPAWIDVWERCWTRRDRRLASGRAVVRALEDALRDKPPAVRIRPRSEDEQERPPSRRLERERRQPSVADRQRFVITNDTIASGTWSLEQIELVVAQEAGVRVNALREPRAQRGAVGRLMHWAEEHLLGEERELYQARAMVWFLAHEFRRDSIEELAARYGVHPRTVDAGIRAVRRRRVPGAVWRAVVQRLVSLPPSVAREAVEVEPSALSTVSAGVALTFSVVLLIPALALIAAGNVVGGLALLALAGSSAMGAGKLLSPNGRQEEWIERHLDAVPGPDRRAKLATLALQTEYKGLSRAARQMLQREPLQLRVRPKLPVVAQPKLHEPRIEARARVPEVPRPERAPEPVEPAPERAEPAPEPAEPAPERAEPEPAARRPSLDEMIRERAARTRDEAPGEETSAESVEERQSIDDLIRERAAAAREEPMVSETPRLDELLRQRAAAARAAEAEEERLAEG